MAEILDQVRVQYPELGSELEPLPEHIHVQIGEVALSMTHEDMHPKVKVEYANGLTGLETNFDQLVTDPLQDGEQLEQQAKAAAESGKQKLSEVLLGGASLLRQAHQELIDEGISFGVEGFEADEQRQGREAWEHQQIYVKAFQLAIDRAKTSKQASQEAQTVATLESLMLLKYTDKPNAHSYETDRRVYREAALAGLSNDLLLAAAESSNLYAGVDHQNIGRATYGLDKLLSLTTGKDIGEDFQVRGDKDFSYLRADNTEEQRDILAAYLCLESKLGAESLVDAFKGYVLISKVEQAAILDRDSDRPESARSLYEALELADSGQDVEAAYKSDNPKLVIEAAKQLDLSVGTVIMMFSVINKEDIMAVRKINTQQLEDMESLKREAPEIFAQMIEMSSTEYGPLQFDPAKVLEGAKKLKEDGFNRKELISAIRMGCEADDVIAAYSEILKELARAGLGPDDFARIVSRGKNPFDKDTLEYRSGGDYIKRAIEVWPAATERIRSEIMLDEFSMKYLELYRTISYPVQDRRHIIERPTLEQLPYLSLTIKELGISSEMAEAMVDSWTTYDSFVIDMYDDHDFILPQEAPNEPTLQRLANRQADALKAQIDSLSEFVGQYGLETTEQIVNNFGIYNFSRHKPEDLFDQLQRWQSGEAVDIAVAEARFDWNSYQPKPVVFEEHRGQGVFYFEASSGLEVAKLAVILGKRERSLGREPEVSRFFVHAHASPDGLVMGTNRETIWTSDYIEAARNAKKINAKEVNDYRRHLGKNFEVVLIGCSTAGNNNGSSNIAERISKAHDTVVYGSEESITGVSILSDGSVRFEGTENGGEATVYDSRV